MGTLPRNLRRAALSSELRRLHLFDHDARQSCPGCRLELAMARQLQVAASFRSANSRQDGR
jgi:hypothetical protein